MSMSFDIAVGGLKAANEGLKVVADNIANADTEGYKRREIVTEEMLPTQKSGVSYGNGVLISQIKTVSEPYLLEKMIQNNSNMAFAEDMYKTFESLEINIGNEALAGKIQDFFNAMEDLKNNPTLEGNKQLVVSETENLLNYFSYSKETITGLIEDQSQLISNEINEINTELTKFEQIISTQNFKADDNNYVADEVEKMVGKLSTYGKVDHYFKDDGTVVIALNGVNVFDQSKVRYLEYNKESNRVYTGKNDITDAFKNTGTLGSKLQLIDTKLDQLLKDYTVLEASMVYEINDLVHKGTVTELKSSIEGSEILSVSTNRSILGLSEEELPNLTDYPLFDIPTLKGIQPGDIVITSFPENEEISININHTTTLTTLKEELEQKAPYLSVSVDNGISITSTKPFSMDDGETNFMSMLGINNFIQYSDSTNKYSVNDKYSEDPELFMEYFDEAETTGMEHNALLINELVDLNHKKINIDNDYLYKLSVAVDCPEYNRTDVTIKSIESYGDEINNINYSIAATVATHKEQFEGIKSNNEFIEAQYEAVVGVNTDEELTKLMKLQAAYQANSKVISAMNELFDSLLAI